MTKFLSRITFASLLLPIAQTLAAIAPYQAGESAQATFTALGRPGLLKVRGEGATVRGEIIIDAQLAKGKFEVDLEQFKTGIGLRDSHMKEKYLETAKHPKALVEVNEVILPASWSPGQDATDVPFKGQLTLKGVAKPIQGKVTIKGPQLATQAEFDFSLQDYPVGVPSYMGITVAERVSVVVEIASFVKKL